MQISGEKPKQVILHSLQGTLPIGPISMKFGLIVDVFNVISAKICGKKIREYRTMP